MPSPETTLELAYLDNPKLFDRDSATRRSKARAELKLKTGAVIKYFTCYETDTTWKVGRMNK